MSATILYIPPLSSSSLAYELFFLTGSFYSAIDANYLVDCASWIGARGRRLPASGVCTTRLGTRGNNRGSCTELVVQELSGCCGRSCQLNYDVYRE